MRLNYAKKVSDVHSKVQGTFDESVKLQREENRKLGIKNKEIKKKRKLIDKVLMLRD